MATEGQGQQDATSTHYLVEEEYTIAVPMVRPRPAFLSFLKLAGASGEVFTKKEIVQYLKAYISSRQLFDVDNPSVVHCAGDMLGEVFNVQQFTIDQVLDLLSQNCIPAPDSCLKKRRRLVPKPVPTSVTISLGSTGSQPPGTVPNTQRTIQTHSDDKSKTSQVTETGSHETSQSLDSGRNDYSQTSQTMTAFNDKYKSSFNNISTAVNDKKCRENQSTSTSNDDKEVTSSENKPVAFKDSSLTNYIDRNDNFVKSEHLQSHKENEGQSDKLLYSTALDLPHTKSRLSSSSSVSDKVSEKSVSSGNQGARSNVITTTTASSLKSDVDGKSKKKCKRKKRKKKNKSKDGPSRKRHHTEPGQVSASGLNPGPSQSHRRRGTSVSITCGGEESGNGSTGYPWYMRVELNDDSDDDDDCSEVLSIQDKETVRVQDSTDDLWFLDDEDSVTLQVASDTDISLQVPSDFSVEYDIESISSPQFDMSESDQTSIISGEGLVVVCKDSDVEFFADYSESDSNDGEFPEADNWTCTACNNINYPLQRFCGKCWMVRQDWLPGDRDSHAKHRDKHLAELKSKRFEQVKALVDSGNGSISSTQPSSQETTFSDISVTKCDTVFDETPTSKLLSLPSINDFHVTDNKSLSVESQSLETRYTFSNVQVGGQATEDPCVICLSQPKTASLIHGSSGHQVCCFKCGKRLKRNGKVCPVCRRPIQKVIKNYII